MVPPTVTKSGTGKQNEAEDVWIQDQRDLNFPLDSSPLTFYVATPLHFMVAVIDGDVRDAYKLHN